MTSDERLARRAQRGDRRAFEAIFERYHQELYRFCLTLVGSRQDAEDALQATMVKVLRSLPGEQRDIRLRPWIYRIARNESIDMIRRRRETVAIGPERIAAGPALAETAEARERLGRLIDDLRELAERQRAALVMRELGDLEFAEIGSALETSAEAARQAVYEARVSLRQMEAGREMRCEECVRAVSDGDGRVIRSREIQAHLRSCPDCRSFHDSIVRRRGELRAIAPLPLAASAAILHGALGAGSGAAGGAVGGAAGAGAGKALLSSTVVKTAATCVVVAAIGTTAAERSGLVDIPIGNGGRQDRETTTPPPRRSSARFLSPSKADKRAAAVPAGRPGISQTPDHRGASAGNRPAVSGSSPAAATPGGKPGATPAPVGESGGHGATGAAKPKKSTPEGGQGKGPGLPASSTHGQQTAAARKSPHGNATPGTPRGAGRGQSSAPPSAPTDAEPTPGKGAPPHSPAAEPPAYGKGGKSTDRATGQPGEAELESSE
ncbi:MAG TPA: sigma-70 family RNA polymerase sigma factor [Solirubrobacterales bacterium]